MATYDRKIMDELLKQPGVKEKVAEMNPAMLDWFKTLLVNQGIYARFVRERKGKK